MLWIWRVAESEYLPYYNTVRPSEKGTSSLTLFSPMTLLLHVPVRRESSTFDRFRRHPFHGQVGVFLTSSARFVRILEGQPKIGYFYNATISQQDIAQCEVSVDNLEMEW